MSLTPLHSINPRRQGSNIYTVLKEKSMLCRISYPVKLMFTYKHKTEIFSNMKKLRVWNPQVYLPIKQYMNDNFVIKEQYQVPGHNEQMNKDQQSFEGRKRDLKILSPAKVSFYLFMYSFSFTSFAFILHLEYKSNKHSQKCKNLKYGI